jgi:hypothetical protein
MASSTSVVGCVQRSKGQLNTERIRGRSVIKARVEFRLLPVLQAILRKVRRLGLRRTTQYQQLTSSVLKPGSPEVWRKTAEENEFWVSAGTSRSGGLRTKPMFIGDFCGFASERRMLDADGLAEGVSPSM